MKKKNKFFFFGFGQSAKYFVKELIDSKITFSFSTTNTKKTQILYFKKKKFKSYKFKNNDYDKKLVKDLILSDFILVSIPPQNNKDIVSS